MLPDDVGLFFPYRNPPNLELISEDVYTLIDVLANCDSHFFFSTDSRVCTLHILLSSNVYMQYAYI